VAEVMKVELEVEELEEEALRRGWDHS